MKRIGLAFLTFTLSIAVVELTARIILPIPDQIIRKTEYDGAPPTNTLTRGRLPYHPEQGLVYMSTPTGRRLRPNTEILIEQHLLSRQSVLIRTSRHGFRGPEIGNKTSRTRILFLGDSITFADYLTEEETFVHQVETLACDDVPPWETINAGVGSIDTKTELAILLETGLSVDPDVVVLCHYLNDFQESPGILSSSIPPLFRSSRLLSFVWIRKRQAESVAESRDAMAAAEMEFRIQLKNEYSNHRQSIPPLREMALDWFFDWGGAWSHRTWEITSRHLAEFAALSRTHHFKPVIVSFPVSMQVYQKELDDYPQQQLKALCEAQGLPFLDLLPVFRTQAFVDNQRLFYDQCHHTPQGSRLAAEAIYEFLHRQVAEKGAADN